MAKQAGLAQHADEAREAYISWLEASGQLQRLGQLAQQEGRLDEALDLFLAASKPAEACQVAPGSWLLVCDFALLLPLAGIWRQASSSAIDIESGSLWSRSMWPWLLCELRQPLYLDTQDCQGTDS